MRRKPSEIIRTLKKNGLDVALTAKELSIHKSTVYRWMKRAKSPYTLEISSKQLARKSTRPNNIYTKLTWQDKKRIKELREAKQYDATKIKAVLNLDISVSTVHRYLKQQNFVRKYPKGRRPRFQDTTHMHARNTKTLGYLQMDVKYVTPELSGLTWTCYEYAVIDIYSRYKEAVILNQLDQDGSILALMQILPRLPFKPIFLQTDNGLEFQQRFRKAVTDLGMRYHYIHKSSPNENALIERSFRTDEEEFYCRLKRRPNHYDELRDWFAKYLNEYNTERPHYGINLLTPAQLVANVLKG